MQKEIDKISETGSMTAVKERKPVNFETLREAVMTARRAKSVADDALAHDLAADQVAISLTGATAADALFSWIDEG